MIYAYIGLNKEVGCDVRVDYVTTDLVAIHKWKETNPSNETSSYYYEEHMLNGYKNNLTCIAGVNCEVDSVVDFARGPDGTCAFCHGDPCNENAETGSAIAAYYAREPDGETCPCCDGRPT